MALSRRSFLAGLFAVSAGTGLAGYHLSRYAVGRFGRMAAADTSGAAYTCSMHTHVRQGSPGPCPICGMTMIKVEGGAVATRAGAQDAVHVPPAVQQQIGVQTAVATLAPLAQTIRAYATIGYDSTATVSVNPRVEGWIRRLAVAGVGQPVRRGQLLYEIYSPELQQRQREYLDLLTRKEGMLASASMEMGAGVNAMTGSLVKEKFRNRARLLAADMNEAQVAELERSRRVIDVVAVYAARDGIVTAVGVQEGNYVNPMQQVLAYADTPRVWAELTLYPDQVGWLKTGDTVRLRSALDGSETRARIDLATLQVDGASRTARLRVPLADRHGAFPPGAFADAEIDARAQTVVSVPREAVVKGARGDYVIVAGAQDHFRRVPVTTGIESADAVAITRGLKAGDRVAVNAQFLLDGALALQAPVSVPKPAEPTHEAGHAGHHHGGMP